MAEQTIEILRVDTGEAIKSVNDLKENIKLLKGNLGELTIGSQEYQDTLEELTINQNALKNAMHATSASMEDVVAAAASMNVEFDAQNKLINKSNISYNELVHTMAALKEEWRSTTDEARRSQLGEQIDEINSRLKDMDASVGNFSRNVGNYESGFSGVAAKFEEWGGFLKQMPPTLGAAKEQIGKVGETMQLVGKQPILGIIGLLAPIIMKITAALQDNETAMGAVQKVMASLQPIFDVFEAVLEKIAQGVAKVAEWFVSLLGESGETFKNIISGAVGVGNVLLQYLLMPINTIINAFKGLGKIIGDVFKGNFKDIKKDAEEAWSGIKESFVKGFSLKENFNLGKQVGEQFAAGLSSSKSKVVEEGEKIGEEVKDAIESKLMEIDWEKGQKALEKRRAAEKAERDAALKEQEEFDALMMAEMEETNAIVDEIFNEMVNASLAATEKEKLSVKERVSAIHTLASATLSVFSSIADMYEADEKSAEKNAKKIKAMRIAEATINTISGALGAFMGITKDTNGWGVALAAAEAATITAAGMAQIAQIKNTNVSASETSNTGTSSRIAAGVSAPMVETGLSSVRNVTTASEEDRLNQMAKEQRVYIVSSDIEAALDGNKTRVEESSF